MILNLAIGAATIFATVLVHTFGLIAIARTMTWLVERFSLEGHGDKVMSIMFVVLGLFLLLSIEVWIWTGVYLALGRFRISSMRCIFRWLPFRPSALATSSRWRNGGCWEGSKP
jgi:hypothetical protein